MSTSAPGIDLEQFREAVDCWESVNRGARDCGVLVPELQKDAQENIDKAIELLALIDASPKGGSTDGLRKAVLKVCEGWTIPDDARKVLETALWATSAEEGAKDRQPIDGCTESNCKRCRTHPDHRGDMEHAGIGWRPGDSY